MSTSRHNPVTQSRAARVRRWSRRGISLIEVVMAATLLAVIASAVVAGITTVVAADSRSQQKLEALELANRLLLQYVDDKQAMPDQELHVTQGRGTYRWALRTSPVELTTPEQSIVDKPTTGPSGKAIEKLQLLAVSVYAGVPDGMGGYTYGDRVCTLSRVYHPLTVVYRNPNKLAAASGDVGELLRIFSEIMGDDIQGSTPPATATPAAPSDGAARPTAPARPIHSTPKPTRSADLFSGSQTSVNRLK